LLKKKNIKKYENFILIKKKKDKWNLTSHEMTRNQNDIFEIFLPNNEDGTPAIKHNTRIKVHIQ